RPPKSLYLIYAWLSSYPSKLYALIVKCLLTGRVLRDTGCSRTYESAQSLESEQPGVADMIAEVATSKSGVTLRSAAALRRVCRGVISGEGSTVVGRVHFSRSIDDYDAVLCALILVLAGRAGDPVSRTEADAMFDISAVAGDRRDLCRFDDLL